jgi:hypothetical protein
MRRSRFVLLCLVISAALPLASAVSAQASTALGPAAPLGGRAVTTTVAPATAHAGIISGEEPGQGTTSRIISNSTASAATGQFYSGYGEVCGGTPGGACKSWWVDLHVGFTVSGPQAWVNGFTQSWCTAGGTNITWCGYTGNGTANLSIGANFGNGGWVRLYIMPDNLGNDGFIWTHNWVQWANYGGWCISANSYCY